MDLLFGIILEAFFFKWLGQEKNPYRKVAVIASCILVVVAFSIIIYALTASSLG